MEIVNNQKKCRVCGDQTSVFFNYNGLSCKSCKKFFLRCAINRNKHSVCLDNNRCTGGKSIRQCQKCRLRKCLEIGMQMELVFVNKSSKSTCSTPKEPSKGTGELNSYELARLTEIQSASTQIEIPLDAPISGIITIITGTFECNPVFARRFVKFCKSVSAFKSLNSADQLILLKESFKEICAINTGFYFDLDKNAIPVAGDDEGDRILLLDCALIGTTMSRNNVLSSKYSKYTMTIKRYMTGDVNIKNLILMQLLFKTRPNIISHEYVHYNHLLYRHLLKRYLDHKYGNTAKTTCEAIQKLLNKIDRPTTLAKELLHHEFTHGKHVNEIFTEIFNLT